METAAVQIQAEPERISAPHLKARHTSLFESLLTGMGALGLALGCERGASFLSNVLAARLAGPATFGIYSLALTTANNVAVYAGAGIGTTANRFVGQFPMASAGYRKLLRALVLIACSSAVLAAVVLWFGATPLARVLVHNTEVAGPLHVAALSAAGIILLECCRGLFIGQRSDRNLIGLSLMVGAGLLVAIPATARFGASPMLAAQAGAVTAAVAASAMWLWRSLSRQKVSGPASAGPSVWRVWRFGMVQLGEIIGLNAAGWWIAALVARSDASMRQMAFFAIANQLRNVTTLVPGLVGQTSFAMLTEERGSGFGGADRVLAVSSIVASLLATLCAGVAMAFLPWVLGILYGSAYEGAELAAVITVAIVVVHMGAAPVASRITILCLRDSGLINLFWSGLVVALGTYYIGRGGAVAAAATFLAAHIVSMFAGLIWLWHRGSLPGPVIGASAANLAVTAVLVSIGWLRCVRMVSTGVALVGILTATAGAVWSLWQLGHRQGYLPESSVVLQGLRARFGTGS